MLLPEVLVGRLKDIEPDSRAGARVRYRSPRGRLSLRLGRSRCRTPSDGRVGVCQIRSKITIAPANGAISTSTSMMPTDAAC